MISTQKVALGLKMLVTPALEHMLSFEYPSMQSCGQKLQKDFC